MVALTVSEVAAMKGRGGKLTRQECAMAVQRGWICTSSAIADHALRHLAVLCVSRELITEQQFAELCEAGEALKFPV
jgi:hypothetical protein